MRRMGLQHDPVNIYKIFTVTIPCEKSESVVDNKVDSLIKISVAYINGEKERVNWDSV